MSKDQPVLIDDGTIVMASAYFHKLLSDTKELKDQIKRIQTNCDHDWEKNVCIYCEAEIQRPEPEGDR